MRIGYARVSTRDQHPEAHADALTGAGCERIYQGPGKLARRPELDEALRGLRAGDQLVVTKLDRLGRSLEHLIDLANDLQLIAAWVNDHDLRRYSSAWISPPGPYSRTRGRRTPQR